MRSSYIENNYGDTLKSYLLSWRPVGLVELGVLDGYSTIAIAEGIRDLEKLYGITTQLKAFDLFDDYKFKHGRQEEVQAEIDKRGLTQYVELAKGDAYKVHTQFEDRHVEFLHIDISNTGQVIRDLMELWHPKIANRGIICIEGGSTQRDEVEWMTKYNMPPIKKEIETNPIINKYYIYGTHFLFPSMTVLLRKWYDD